MSKINKKFILAGSNSLINQSKITGYIDLKPLNELYIYDYYLDFTKDSVKFKDYHNLLRSTIFDLRNNLDNLCNIKSVLNNNNTIEETSSNVAPIITGQIAVTLTNTNPYTISISDINKFYFDQNNDSLQGVMFYISRVTEGTFKYNGIGINSNIFLTPNQVSNLTYTPDSNTYNVSLPFRVKDTNINSLYSIEYDYNINVEIESIAVNQPASIGDITLYAENRSTTIINIDMLTNQLTPPYNDPEGDALDAIRIDEISTANKGKFFYNNAEITEGLIIFKQDIIDELFVHVASDINDISSDVFNFSVRDTGSGQWSKA